MYFYVLALGLGHSTEKHAVMYLMYQGFKDKLQLHSDDVSAIQVLAKFTTRLCLDCMYGSLNECLSEYFVIYLLQTLYGPKVERSVNNKISGEAFNPSASSAKMDGMMSATDSRENLPDLCTDPKIDAISTLADKHIYVFKGDYYFRMKFGHPYSREQYPRRINETFYGLPSNLDTVLTISSGKTYYFKVRLFGSCHNILCHSIIDFWIYLCN